MRTRLNPESAVPLYHQVVRAIEYRIATGDLRTGDRLPSLRDAAEAWGINMHTVRKAYASLVSRGVVETQQGAGTVVRGSSPPQGAGAATHAPAREWSPDGSIHDFIDLIVSEAGERWGVTPGELGRLLNARAGGEPVWVIECSDIQARDLAQQVRLRTGADARGWSLENPSDVPPGRMVATHFHFGDVRRRWPDRLPEVQFVAIRPDPSIRQRVRQCIAQPGGPVLVCERGAAMAANVAADLSPVLQDVAQVQTLVSRDTRTFLSESSADTPMLFAPRVWAELSEAERQDPRAIEIRYLIDEPDLEALAEKLASPKDGSLSEVPTWS